MKKEHKKLFDEYFLNFWKGLNKNLKKKLTEEHKSAYEKKLFSLYSNLCKVLDSEEALIYIFCVPNLILARFNKDRLRESRPVIEYFLKVIDYYLENDVSESSACKHIFDKYNLDSLCKEEANFKNMFRKWYKNIYYKDQYSKIDLYVKKKQERALKKKIEIFEVTDKSELKNLFN